VLGACADKSVQLCDLATQQMRQVAAVSPGEMLLPFGEPPWPLPMRLQHDSPVKTVNVLPELGVIMTGSWDKTLRFWDLRSPQPAASFNLSGPPAHPQRWGARPPASP
jgi:WD40 repeat protein